MNGTISPKSILQELTEIQSWLREQGEHRKSNMIDFAKGYVNQAESIQSAVLVLKAKLKEDPNLFLCWQSNIAKAVYDRMNNGKKFRLINNKQIHELCNKGAVDFLNRFISD